MNKIKTMLSAVCLLAGSTSLMAQATIYDAERFMSTDLNGTARFVGMGGAMSALGGDISTMGTNPAGIGLYRSGDAMISFGFNSYKSNSDLSGSKRDADRFTGSFDNLGFVYAHKVGDVTPLRFVNFGFNYHRSKGFNRNFSMAGDLNGVSLTDQMADMATGISPDLLDQKNAFNNNNIGWLPLLGWKGNMVYNYDGTNEYTGYDSDILYPYGRYTLKESGGLHSYDFNVSFNILDCVYLGATVGAYSVDYSRYSVYDEDFINDSGFTLENWSSTTGNGVDFKLGVIVRPSDYFRFGVAVHTPTYFNLRDLSSARLNASMEDLNSPGIFDDVILDTLDEVGDLETEYKIVTPWKFNLSLGSTIGSKAAIGVEYEYSDYSSVKLKDFNGDNMVYENEDAKNYFNGVHTIRVGAEVKVLPSLALRAGYNHITASTSRDAYKILPNYSARTDAEYFNGQAINNYTLGFGYRGNSPFYADVAYQLNHSKADFYAFDDLDTGYLPTTEVTNKRHQFLVTLGMRF